MPSDERVAQALRALAAPCATFRSAAAEASDHARSILAARSSTNEGGGRSVRELGVFAAGRIDARRFDALFDHDANLDPAAARALHRAAHVLGEVAGLDAAAHRASVSSGGNLHDAAISALASLGRAFGAARVAELAQGGRYRASAHDVWLIAFRPTWWNRVERRLAPPLVLEVDGADLRASGLDELLDGAQKIVLVVRGAAPPAPLVRLVTPGVFVMQTPDPADLGRLAAFEGPAVAALLPEGAAEFVHDPAGGPTIAERLRVTSLPDAEPRAPLGRISAAQQTEELRQLAALTTVPVAGPAGVLLDPAAGLPPADPADRLAAWLLSRADLAGLGANGGGAA